MAGQIKKGGGEVVEPNDSLSILDHASLKSWLDSVMVDAPEVEVKHNLGVYTISCSGYRIEIKNNPLTMADQIGKMMQRELIVKRELRELRQIIKSRE